ncbi:MAG: hypothetical protein H7844_07890 [Nitrospirae bacterium YQR-1]
MIITGNSREADTFIGKTTIFLLFAVLFILTLPPFYHVLTAELDDSYLVGLNKVLLMNYNFGKDIVSTYGPIGYLKSPLYIDRAHWIGSVVFTFYVHITFFAALLLFLKKVKASTSVYLYVLLSLFIFLQAKNRIEPYLYFYLFIFSYLYCKRQKPSYLYLLLLIPQFAVLAYIKISLGIFLILIAATLTGFLLYMKRYGEALFVVMLYIVSLFASGRLLIGSFSDMFVFFKNSMQLTAYYAEAVSVTGELWQVLTAILFWCIYIGLIIYNFIRGGGNGLLFLVFSFALCLGSFKHGFMRHTDLHAIDFFATWGLINILFFAEIQNMRKTFKRFVFIYSLLFPLIFTIILYPKNIVPLNTTISQMSALTEILFNEKEFAPKEKNRKMLRQFFSLSPETINLINGHTVDIIPFDIALTELYDLNYRPRPVFQSYNAYTSQLDKLGAEFYKSNRAPEFIIYKNDSLDGKEPVFYEPETFRTILLRYSRVHSDGKFLILRKHGTPKKYEETSAGSLTASVGEPFKMPVYVSDTLVFARIRMDYNFAGRLLALAYKPPMTYFEVYIDGKRTDKSRFVFRNAVNGIFLSPFIPSGSTTTGEFAITTPYPVFFKNNIEVEFFTVHLAF